jgi:hypothetical protein
MNFDLPCVFVTEGQPIPRGLQLRIANFPAHTVDQVRDLVKAVISLR